MLNLFMEGKKLNYRKLFPITNISFLIYQIFLGKSGININETKGTGQGISLSKYMPTNRKTRSPKENHKQQNLVLT